MGINAHLKVAYGLSDALLNVFPVPIVSKRNPTISDKAELGTVWINRLTNNAFVITSVVSNIATWVDFAGGSGLFTSLTVNPGDATISAGNLAVTLGDITAGAGNINATSGNISAGGTLTAGTGLTVTSGNVTVSSGDVIVTGSVAASSVTSGLMLSATGDFGSGFATITSFTNVTDTSQSTGTLVIKSDSANPGNNAGFIKVYVGLTPAFIPYFTNIAP